MYVIIISSFYVLSAQEETQETRQASSLEELAWQMQFPQHPTLSPSHAVVMPSTHVYHVESNICSMQQLLT